MRSPQKIIALALPVVGPLTESAKKYFYGCKEKLVIFQLQNG